MKKLVFNLMFLAATIFILFQSENVYATEYYNIGTDGGEWDGNHYIIDGNVIRNSFFSDGSYTYFLMSDGTPMKDRLTYHPNGRNVIYFDKDGHEAFNNFKHVTKSISGKAVDDYWVLKAITSAIKSREFVVILHRAFFDVQQVLVIKNLFDTLSIVL